MNRKIIAYLLISSLIILTFVSVVTCTKSDAFITYSVEYQIISGNEENLYTSICYSNEGKNCHYEQTGTNRINIQFYAERVQKLTFSIGCSDLLDTICGKIKVKAIIEDNNLIGNAWSNILEEDVVLYKNHDKSWSYEYYLDN